MSKDLNIIVLSGVSAGDTFKYSLNEGQSITIGRAIESSLVLQDPAVSRNHATVTLKNRFFYLSDNGSSHGTFHMGFRLQKGEENARKLSSDDEFKIGESLFRASFEEEVEIMEKTNQEDRKSGHQKAKGPFSKKILAIVALLLVLLAGLFFSTSDNGSKLPKQNSATALSIPQFRVMGYLIDGKSKDERDRSRLDKAQFTLPASDILVEFDFRAESEVEIYIDEAFIGKLRPYTSGWQHQQLLIRDVASGEERKLIFDNTDYPRAQKTKSPYKRWGIRNIRATPLTREVGASFDSQLSKVIALVTVLDTSSESLFGVIRAFQKLVLESIHELSIEAVNVEVSLENSMPSSLVLQENLNGIQLERAAVDYSPSVANRHLSVLTGVLAQLDAELWNRVNSRLISAENSANVKRYIDAHDSLLGVMSMFPHEDDYRWELAKAMFDNTKIVPAKVKAKPEKFRNARK